MGLTFRNIKGSSLTNNEVDANFRHFTGSHEISGSLTVESISGTLVAPTSSLPFDFTGSAATEGTFRFAASGSNHFIYAYVGGGWRSGSLS